MPALSKQTNKHAALFLEGGDSVGKNELVRSIAKYILLAKPNQKILLMNFPQFWFFGHDIRLVIRGACDELLQKTTGVENAFIRSCLYGMDRDLALLLAEPYLDANKNIIVLSDRGPYSSCVTTGYLWANGVVKEEEVKKDIVPKAFEIADAGMLSYFDAKPLLCTAQGKFHLGSRKALDKYEAELPQRYSYEVYRMMGLPEIITRDKDKWRDRKELAKEALTTMGYGQIANIEVSDESFAYDGILLRAYNEKRLILVGPELFLAHFRAGGLVDTRLKGMIAKWTKLSLTAEIETPGERKEILDDLETKIALSIKRKTPFLEYLNIRRSPRAKEAIAKLFDQYPVLFDIIHRTSGKAMTTFFEGLLSSEQLRMPF